MRHTQKSKLSPSLGCIQILKNGKRKSTSVSLYSIQTEKLFTLWSFGVPMKTAGNTGVALQGLAKYCLNVFVAYNWKWNIFVDLWHVWTHEVLWWFYNLNSHGNYLQRGTASHNYIETDLSVLTMTFWDTRKNCWYVASCYHWCHVNRQAMGGNLCWFSSWLFYKSGRRVQFFLLSWSYTPNWTTVYPVMQVLMGGGKLMSSRFGFLLFMICFLGDSATYIFYPSGSKRRLDPRALSWCNIRERSSLCLPSARCEPCVLE